MLFQFGIQPLDELLTGEAVQLHATPAIALPCFLAAEELNFFCRVAGRQYVRLQRRRQAGLRNAPDCTSGRKSGRMVAIFAILEWSPEIGAPLRPGTA